MTTQPTNVPVFILAGGLGTRISEETLVRPKPMIEIGGYPILLHIMRYYYSFGFNDFIICGGYLSRMIKEYFQNYELQYNHLEIDSRNCTDEGLSGDLNVFSVAGRSLENWRVRVLDTGADAMTGARVARAIDIIETRDGKPLETFALTYGDGLTNCNLAKELEFHLEHKGAGTVLGVRPPARFGEIDYQEDGKVIGFLEKPESRHGFINGGFFFFDRRFREYLSAEDSCILERTPLENLSESSELYMYQHKGFWSCMDTMRDKIYLQDLWDSNECPWMTRSNAR